MAMLGSCYPLLADAQTLVLGKQLCFSVSALNQPNDALKSLHFTCRGTPAGYQRQSLWLHADLTRFPRSADALDLMIHQTRFDRLAVGFSYSDGTVKWQEVRSGDFGSNWRAGGQIAFGVPDRDKQLVALTMRFDRLASHELARARLVPRDLGSVQSATLAMLIGAAFTLLLVGALYNLSLAIAVRRQFFAWHGAWAACMLIWGAIWSELDLLIVPGIAGSASSQICTLLATLAVTLATVSAVTSLDRTVLPRWAAVFTLILGISVGLVGIPAALSRDASIQWLGDTLGILVLADLAAVAICLTVAWRRGSSDARDLAGAWSVPMAALALTQIFDVGNSLWGGGAQILVLFAAAWQTLWLSVAATRRLAQLRIERDRARAAEARASELAGRDPLTGLRNRRGFAAPIAPLLEYARAENAPIALLLIDIDRFKSINDMFGHEAGDSVLTVIAQRLERWEGTMCAVARLGGEEFALLIAGIDGVALARFADSVRMEIAACDHRDMIGDRLVTVSIGVAEGRSGPDLQKLYRLADRALYAAKQGGRNRVVIQHLPGVPPQLPDSPGVQLAHA